MQDNIWNSIRVQPSTSQLNYYYGAKGQEQGPVARFYLIGGSFVNRANRGVFMCPADDGSYFWNKILPRQAWDAVNYPYMSLVATKQSKKPHPVYFDLDCKNVRTKWGNQEYTAVGLMVLYTLHQCFPNNKWTTNMPFLIICSPLNSEGPVKQVCSQCESVNIVPEQNSFKCQDCQHIGNTIPCQFFKPGLHIHVAQHRNAAGDALHFKQVGARTYEGTGPCLMFDDMMVVRNMVVANWLQFSKEIPPEVLEQFPGMAHLPKTNEKQVQDWVDLAVYGSKRGELKPGINGSLRIILAPKIRQCDLCDESGNTGCLLCGGAGKVHDHDRVYQAQCVFDFEGNRMKKFENMYSHGTLDNVLAFSRATSLTLPPMPEGWTTPGFVVPKGFEGSSCPDRWIDPLNAAQCDGLTGVGRPITKRSLRKVVHRKMKGSDKRGVVFNSPEWKIMKRLVQESFNPKYSKEWNINDPFCYVTKEGQKGVYICGISGKYKSHCKNARNCRHRMLRAGGTNDAMKGQKCTDPECRCIGVHNRDAPLYIKLSPTRGGRFEPRITLNCHSTHGGFMNNTCCRDYGPIESVAIGRVDANRLWPTRATSSSSDSFKTVKLSVTGNATSGSKAAVKRNNIHSLFGLGKGPTMKKRK